MGLNPPGSALRGAGVLLSAKTLLARPQQWVMAGETLVPYWHRWITYLAILLVAGMMGMGSSMLIGSIKEADRREKIALEQRIEQTIRGWETTKAELAIERAKPWWKRLTHWW
ncbi:MAG: hypothetical protein WCK77_21895 [Verrucomicrobiota bacterium]